MIRKFLFFNLVLAFVFSSSWSQNAVTDSSIKISLITCGLGTELYSGFGHSAIRIVHHNEDIVYNYGTFNFGDSNFYYKFTKGKLPYWVAKEKFENFLYTYQVEGRSVYEQQLNLDAISAQAIFSFLENNIKEENKYYHYDFLFDNCSTRLRDIFEKTLGSNFHWGKAMANKKLSFRDQINFNLKNNHWARTGINLLLGSKVDQIMTNESAMFLPAYLMNAMRDARFNNKKLVSQTIEILPNKVSNEIPRNDVKYYLWLFFILSFLMSFFVKLKSKLIYLDIVVFFIMGLLGCLMLFMWFGTNHQSCAMNRNLVWALPTHLILAFLIARNSNKVQILARISLAILFAGIVWNLFAKQVFISEITPLLLWLIWRLNHYRKNIISSQYDNIQYRFASFGKGKL